MPVTIKLWIHTNSPNFQLFPTGPYLSEVRSIDFDIQPEKRMHFFCFLLFWESFNCYNFGTTHPIQVGFSAKSTSPNKNFDQIENWKCHMFDFWLIPLDRITCFILRRNPERNKFRFWTYPIFWQQVALCGGVFYISYAPDSSEITLQNSILLTPHLHHNKNTHLFT